MTLPSLRLAPLLLALSLGCAHVNTASSTGDAAPKWIFQTPEESGALYARGIAGPTYNEEDGPKAAVDRGKKQLAETLATHVISAQLIVNTNNGSQYDQASYVPKESKDFQDTIDQNAEVIATWVDHTGAYSSGVIGTSYALVRLKLAGIAASGPTAQH